MPEAEALKSDSTDRDTLRKMCEIRGIEFDGRWGAMKLQREINEYEARNAPPGDLKDQVEVANPGFSSDAPQKPDWASSETSATVPSPGAEDAVSNVKFQAPEHSTPVNHEIPGNVEDALEWLSHSSIGRVKLIRKYIDSLHAR